MKKSSSNKEPRWLRNHWRILKDALNRSDFQKEIQEIREQKAEDQFSPPFLMNEGFSNLITKHGVPLSCCNAIEYLINNPEANDEELRARILPPILWISHYRGLAGPAKDKKDEYGIRTYYGKKARDDALIIEVMPFTKVSEIKDFLDTYKDELDDILKNPSDDSNWLFPPRLSKRADMPNEYEEKILELHFEGKKAPEIAKELGLDGRVDTPNIRRTISNAKKKRNASN